MKSLSMWDLAQGLLGFTRPAFQVVTRPEGSRSDLNVQFLLNTVRVSFEGIEVSPVGNAVQGAVNCLHTQLVPRRS